jgi:hypothetical protein
LLDKLGFSRDSYNGQSFRIGAATAAHEARIEDHLIQTQMPLCLKIVKVALAENISKLLKQGK